MPSAAVEEPLKRRIAVFVLAALLLPLSLLFAPRLSATSSESANGILPRSAIERTIQTGLGYLRDGWVDPVHMRLYLLHDEGEHQTTVIDLTTQTVVGTGVLPYPPGLGTLSPDGRRLYAVPNNLFEFDELMVVDTATLTQIASLPLDADLPRADFTGIHAGPGNRLYLSQHHGVESGVYILDATTGATLLHFKEEAWLGATAVSGQNLIIIEFMPEQDVWMMRRYDISSVQPVLQKEVTLAANLYPDALQIAPDQSALAMTCLHCHTIELYDLETLEHVRTLRDEEGRQFRDAQFSLDSRHIFGQMWEDDLVALELDVATGEATQQIVISTNYGAMLLRPLPDGKLAVVNYEEVEFHRLMTDMLVMPLLFNNFCGGPVRDDFSDPNSGWPRGDDGVVAVGYVDGQYSILHRQADHWIAVTRDERWVNSEQVRVTARLASGNGLVGMIFGLNDDWSEFYTMEVAPHYRAYLVRHFTAAEGWETLAIYQSVDGIHTGSEPNVLRIERQWAGSDQEEVRLIVNNRTMTLPEPLPDTAFNGRVGLTGASFEANTDIRHSL